MEGPGDCSRPGREEVVKTIHRCAIFGTVAVGILVSFLIVPAMAVFPVAQFTMNPSSGMGQAPLTVYFTDASTGNIGGWQWDFGDGSTSDVQNPVHGYQYTGTYPVTLTVYPPASPNTAFLNPPNVTRTVIVYTPTLTLSPSSGRAGTQVMVSGNSFNLYGTEFASATVFFDGAQVAENIPITRNGGFGSFSTSFTVPAGTSPGVYTVRAMGPKDSAEDTFEVTNIPPRAIIAASPQSGMAPLSVNFNGTRSSDEDGTITSYQWNFGDDTSATGPTVDHTYTRSGEYHATLTVTDDQRASGTARISINLNNIPPVAVPVAEPQSGSKPLTVRLDGSKSYDTDGTISSYHWDLGDGTRDEKSVVIHTYSNPGNFQALLTVTDNLGATGNAAVLISVINEPPVARINVSPKEGPAPLEVTFDGSQSYDPDDPDLTFLWDFGDGQKGSGMILTHTYREAGTYKVSLQVADPQGGTGKALASVTVNQPFPWWFFVIGILGAAAGTVTYREWPRVKGPGDSLPKDCKYPKPLPRIEINTGVECKMKKENGLPDISFEIRSGIYSEGERK